MLTKHSLLQLAMGPMYIFAFKCSTSVWPFHRLLLLFLLESEWRFQCWWLIPRRWSGLTERKSLFNDTRPGRLRYTTYGWLWGLILWSFFCSPCSWLRTGSTRGVSKSLTFWLYLLIYATEFNDYNGAIFSISARALNNLVYWIAQIIGSIAIGPILDHKRMRRRTRAFVSIGILTALVFLVHIWAYFYQKYGSRNLYRFN